MSSALAYNKDPLVIVDNPVPPFVTPHSPVTVPVKSMPDINPDVALLQRLRSIPASNTVNTILSEVVATVNNPVSPDFIPLNTI